MTRPCPCGSGLPLSLCCGRYLVDFAGTPAPDAEALMRSRYSAFVLQDRAYLLATWHASRRPAALELDAGAKWLGLEVRSHRRIDEDHAEVEFVARCRPSSDSGQPNAGKAERIHERSRFVRENGRWYYLDGALS